MSKKRYSSAEEIHGFINRRHAANERDSKTICMLREANKAGGLAQHVIDFNKARILTLERSIKRREQNLASLKAKLGEIQTLPLPLMIDVMAEGSVKR